MMTNEQRAKNAGKVAEILTKHPELQSIIAPISGVNVPYSSDTQKLKAGLEKMNIPSITFGEKKTISFDI